VELGAGSQLVPLHKYPQIHRQKNEELIITIQWQPVICEKLVGIFHLGFVNTTLLVLNAPKARLVAKQQVE